MRTIIMVAAAFVLGGLVTTCSPSGSSAPEAHAQLPGGERIVGATDFDAIPTGTSRETYLDISATILLLRPDGSFRICKYYQDWHCEAAIPAIPPTQ